ncbi:MAG: hypothetical protein WCR51_14295 [Planctomycetia bacterium]
MTVRSAVAKSFVALLAVAFVMGTGAAEAARPRRPSAAQVKKMKEELEYRQKEMLRVQQEIAAKERELYLSFDENGNGKLEGAEKAKYDKQLHAIKTGKAPNPLSTIAPPGQGPRDSASSTKK